MITAEEFFEKETSGFLDEKECKKLMIEFAKLHVQEALKQASELAEADFEPMGWLADQHLNEPFIEGEDYEVPVIRSTILNAYPLDLIK